MDSVLDTKTVLPRNLAGGPHGLGDPDDRSLRRVEIEVVIPKIMRDKARTEKCAPEVDEFNKCVRDTSFAMVLKCRNENSLMRDCLAHWFQDEGFRKECTDIYLNERSEFRRTGVRKMSKRFGH